MVINSEVWGQFTKHHLKKNMRVERLIDIDPTTAEKLKSYADWLLRLGNGKLTPVCRDTTVCRDMIEVPDQMVCQNHQELEDKVYDNFNENICRMRIVCTKEQQCL